ncbi:MAG TPA: ABC transporter permease subunit [Bryobacteraceae bacterium]|nr:ABC transporter permease subunit [Bryobacteraceae bacterium]
MKARTVTAYWNTLISRFFGWRSSPSRGWNWGDAVALITVTVLIYTGVRLAFEAPAVIRGPEISLSPQYLVLYSLLSFSRMLAAYALSLVFTIAYGYIAAYNQRAGQFMVPLLDVLQSVPILSFLPIVLLGLAAVLPQEVAAELASVVLIFTSQVWNLTFSWYQSLKTIPNELREASSVFSLDRWLRFKTLELPFAALGLVWNSIMSWAGGWFFLMAAEIFTVGQRDFRLPGIGGYLSEAARRGDLSAISQGLLVLIAMIALLDQVVWRPLLAWSERFKLDTVGAATEPSSWFLGAWRNSRVIAPAVQRVLGSVLLRLDRMIGRLLADGVARESEQARLRWHSAAAAIVGGGVLLYGSYRTIAMLLEIPGAAWGAIALGLLATGVRVFAAVLVALAWTVPLGVAIGTKPRVAAWLQPLVQIAASVPATALFPVLLLGLLRLPAGLNIAAIVLMLMGTQWYLLFNVIAGASAVPQDLKYTTALLRLSRWQRWRILILPALFPYIITGLITAAGGAWNASIVAEYTQFGGSVRSVTGIGSTISIATAKGDYPLLLAATLSMVFAVVAINRVVWRPLYRLAEERYRLE